MRSGRGGCGSRSAGRAGTSTSSRSRKRNRRRPSNRPSRPLGQTPNRLGSTPRTRGRTRPTSIRSSARSTSSSPKPAYAGGSLPAPLLDGCVQPAGGRTWRSFLADASTPARSTGVRRSVPAISLRHRDARLVRTGAERWDAGRPRPIRLRPCCERCSALLPAGGPVRAELAPVRRLGRAVLRRGRAAAPAWPHLHLAMRGTVSRVELRQVAAATYHQVWWPQCNRVLYDCVLPTWDPDREGVRRPGDGRTAAYLE